MYTAAPDIITSVIIDLDTVNIDDDNVSFTLSWNEPFTNFDPIVNYTFTINCTDNATCPVIVDTDNVTRTADVNFITDLSMMTTLSVTAINSIDTSDPAIRTITSMYCVQVMYIHAYICTFVCISEYVCLLYAKMHISILYEHIRTYIVTIVYLYVNCVNYMCIFSNMIQIRNS